MIDTILEARAEAAYLAHQDAMKPRNRFRWASITENSKDPWRAVARALEPGAEDKARRSVNAIVAEVLEDRAAYFERTSGHFDRKDAARSYRQSAKDISDALARQ